MGLAASSVAGTAGVASGAGCSKGATGAGSSILGGCSSTLAGVATSAFGFPWKRPTKRPESRRPSLTLSEVSSFFSSYPYKSINNYTRTTQDIALTLTSLASSVGFVSVASGSAGAAGVSATAASLQIAGQRGLGYTDRGHSPHGLGGGDLRDRCLFGSGFLDRLLGRSRLVQR